MLNACAELVVNDLIEQAQAAIPEINAILGLEISPISIYGTRLIDYQAIGTAAIVTPKD